MVKDIQLLEKVQQRATKCVYTVWRIRLRIRGWRFSEFQHCSIDVNEGGLIGTFKILTGKENINVNQLFHLPSNIYTVWEVTTWSCTRINLIDVQWAYVLLSPTVRLSHATFYTNFVFRIKLINWWLLQSSIGCRCAENLVLLIRSVHRRQERPFELCDSCQATPVSTLLDHRRKWHSTGWGRGHQRSLDSRHGQYSNYINIYVQCFIRALQPS